MNKKFSEMNINNTSAQLMILNIDNFWYWLSLYDGKYFVENKYMYRMCHKCWCVLKIRLYFQSTSTSIKSFQQM